MAFKITDEIKNKLNNCCKACQIGLFGTKLQNLGADLDAGSTTLSSKLTETEAMLLGGMCESNKIIVDRFNSLVDKLKDVGKPDIKVLSDIEIKQIDGSCDSFKGIGTVLNEIILELNASDIGATITFSREAVAEGATVTASTEESGTLAWSSSDVTIATVVAATGVITPLTEGLSDISYLSSTGMGNTKSLSVAAAG